MKILIAADIFPPESGGPATYAVTLANELTKQGDEVTVVSLNPQSDKSAVNCSLLIVNYKNKLLRYAHYFWLLFRYAKSVDVIYAMGPVNAGLPALVAARLRHKKFVVKVVGDYAWEQGQVSGRVKDSIDDFQNKTCGGKIGWLQKIERKVVKSADCVIVPSKYLAGIVKGWGVKENKVEVVYNNVEFKVAEPIKHEGEKWLVSVGRLLPWKGMDTLIAISAELSVKAPEQNWKLKIVGDGPEMEKLKKQVDNNRLSSIVELLGNLPREKSLIYMASADVFVLNSAYEGLSHVIVEANQQGVPVLASRVGGNSEMVIGDALFEHNNKEEIIEKVLHFSSQDKGVNIPHRFAVEMIEGTKKLLQNLCAN